MAAHLLRYPYYRELGGAMILYSIILVASLKFGGTLPPGALQTVIYLSPTIGIFLSIWAIVRQIRRSDEYVRKSTVEQLAITAAITAGWTLTYGFLENAGFPRLSMFTVWPVMGAVWIALSLINVVRNR